MNAFWNEIRFALRQIRKTPAFSATVILTLAIGLAGNTTMFSVMDAVIFRPLAVPHLDRLVVLASRGADGVDHRAAWADQADWQAQSRSLSGVAAHRGKEMGLTGMGDPEHVSVAQTTANLFPLLGIEPSTGRGFRNGEDQPGRDAEVVLTYSFWQKHFAGQQDVLGRTLTLDERPYQIVGVLPQSFRYAAENDLFVPLALSTAEKQDRVRRDFTVLAQLAPGVTLAQAQSELSAISKRLETAYPAADRGWSVRAEALLDEINGEYTPMYMRMMMGAGFFLLVIICANVSNLLFARSVARRQEIAVREALGAGRGRIIRQLLLESVLLSLAGAAAGFLLARVEIHLTLMAMPPRIARYLPGWEHIGLDWRAVLYGLTLALVSGVLAGLAPTLSSLRVAIADELKAGGRSVSGDRKSHRLRSLFAVAQIALSVALVAGASLMGSGMRAMLRVADRFDPQHMLVFRTELPGKRYSTDAERKAFYDRALSGMRAIPGVRSAELSMAFPYNNTGVWWQDFEIEHSPTLPGELRNTQRLSVSPNYLASLGLGVLRGRELSASDNLNTQPVAVISEKLAERYFGKQDPVGQKIRLGKDSDATPWLTVVGVVSDVTLLWIDQRPEPAVYLSYAQFPSHDTWWAIRTSGDPSAVAPAVRHALSSVDPLLPPDDVESYATLLDEGFIGLSYVVVILMVDAGLALLLSALGIFGVMSNAVAERRHEIGVRMALGAGRAQIGRMVLARAMLLTGVGLAAGVPLALGLAHLTASLIMGTSATDGLIFALTALTIAAVGVVASAIPAQRAASVQPMQALRSE